MAKKEEKKKKGYIQNVKKTVNTENIVSRKTLIIVSHLKKIPHWK